MTIEFFIPGKVEPKGRARSSIAKGKQGLFVRHHTPSNTRAFEAIVRGECEQAMGGKQFTGPVMAELVFVMPRPAGRPREYWCTTKPDADNLAKTVLDAMNLIAFKDDGCISCLGVRKVYESEYTPPGVRVVLSDAEIPNSWITYLRHQDTAKQQRKDDEKAARQAARDAQKAEKKRLAAEAREAKKRRVA